MKTKFRKIHVDTYLCLPPVDYAATSRHQRHSQEGSCFGANILEHLIAYVMTIPYQAARQTARLRAAHYMHCSREPTLVILYNTLVIKYSTLSTLLKGHFGTFVIM